LSRETFEWLNQYTLIGFTDKRGNAWHYREAMQGAESNHYPGAIPVDDVLRRLFNFTVDEQELYILTDTGFQVVPGRKAMVTSDSQDVLGIFKPGYRGHQYQEWLVDYVSYLIDGDLGIGSAGLLRNRGQAWLSIEVPENIVTKEGVEFRPNLVAMTSFDGTLATSYGRKITAVVCDNTLDIARGEKGQEFKVKHSKYSEMRIQDAREALNIVFSMADDFADEVATLTSWKVSDVEWEKLLDIEVPLVNEKGEKLEGRGLTTASNKREQLSILYKNDRRAAPWTGTAYGVLAAFNTWNHHYASVRGQVPRGMRNMENMVNGNFGKADAAVMSNLSLVTA
jgi:phage/plasmid-like protein (TIGR03299 family)